MKSKFIKYHGMTEKDFLEALSEEFEFPLEPPIDLIKILETLEIKLDESIDFDRIGTVGSVSIGEGGVPTIWVNPIENDFEPRRRFTIAHELGHLIKHIDPEIGIKEFMDTEKTLNRKESYWDSKEYEANNFAARLLMPASLLKKHGNIIISEYKQETGKKGIPVDIFIEKMAKLFNVSKPAMRYRLKNIGAIK